jgi:hypothetical protein
VGIGPREGNNHVIGEYTEITRMMRALAYNTEIIKAHNLRFDHLKIMEDFDMTLSLLELGYPNRVSYKYANGQRTSGDAGGCSIYRNRAAQREGAIQLYKRHPKYVKIVGKKTKTSWSDMGNVRTDVRINWKDAYKPKIRKSNEKEGLLLAYIK